MQAIIRLFVTHRNAGNLLMVLMLVAGFAAMTRINTQFFPDFSFPAVHVGVAWPGASAEDVEGNIIEAVEAEVRYLNGVKRVISYASEGYASINIEFENGTNIQEASADVETAVDQVTTFPKDSERPIFSRIAPYDTIMRVVVSGPFPEAALRSYAKHIRDEMLDAGVDKVDFLGLRDPEIQVEISDSALRQLGLTISDISNRIAAQSQDVPSGTLEGAIERQVRSVGEAETPEAIGAIEVRSRQSGEKIYLRDIASITESFDEREPTALRHGQPAIELHVQRASTADALSTSAVAKSVIADLKERMPPTLAIEVYAVNADQVQARIDMLVKNGLGGLILVCVILYVFLNGRLAFWVAAGIPVAMLATIALMLFMGQSINMISLFGLIMCLGIVVDDAIVVGEHSATMREQGLSPIEAATQGARRMLAPVTAASLTTVAAFVPILMVRNEIGDIMGAITFVVVAVIIASIVECFLILPGHLRHGLRDDPEQANGLRKFFDDNFDRFKTGPFRRFLRVCYDWRYTTVATAITCLMLAVGMMASGRVLFEFFPSPESDTVKANIVFVPGTPRSEVEAMLNEFDRATNLVEAQLSQATDEHEGGPVVKMTLGIVGQTRFGFFSMISGDHVGGFEIQLHDSDQRHVRTKEFIAALQDEVRVPAGIERLVIREELSGPPGEDLDVRLYGGDVSTLKQAGQEVRQLISRFPGVSNIDDDLPYGKPELILELAPRGAAMGFTTQSIGREVRNAFEGAIAKRFARGDEEVTIRVQLPEETSNTEALRNLYVTSPMGQKVPLSEVVTVREKSGFARIRHDDGRREISVSAGLDAHVMSVPEAVAAVEAAGLTQIADTDGLQYRFSGRMEDQQAAFADLGLGAQVALAAIYIILAWVFASYLRPIVVMSIIPFGLLGAIVGHYVMGLSINMLSLIALLGLAGILVNDSIILVSTIDELMEKGKSVREAVLEGTEARLRAVLLTSLTTVGGLLPLLFETSLQAQFVLPMAVTIAFGLGTATFLVLLVVPSLVGIQEDIRNRFGVSRSPRHISDDYADGIAE